MILKITVVTSFICCLLFLRNGYCEDTEDIPEWLKRVEVSAQVETDKQPIFYFQTVQPFYQSPDKVDTVFYQPRVSVKGERGTYNLGVGYRRIIDNNILLGANLFGDYQDLHQHGRLGMGLEALGHVLETRINAYFGVSGKREVLDTSAGTTYEKVVDGLDYEIGAPLPYLPWLKFYTSGFWYDYEKASDKEGWKARLEAKPNNFVTFEVYTWDDNKGEQEYGGRVRFNIFFDKAEDFKEALKFSEEPFPKKDLKEDVLIPVERNFDIITERWTESGTMTVSVGRNN